VVVDTARTHRKSGYVRTQSSIRLSDCAKVRFLLATLEALVPRSEKLENLQLTASMLRLMRAQMDIFGEDLLTYLLDMAYLEAIDRARAIKSEINLETSEQKMRR